MSKPDQATVVTLRQQMVLEHLQGGACTWQQLRARLEVNDDNLGFIILDLLNQRKIWTVQKNDVRVYGLERRSGLVPRFSYPQRRATDGER